eukprot:2253897-Pleurochrysis_carterae.AAC.1
MSPRKNGPDRKKLLQGVRAPTGSAKRLRMSKLSFERRSRGLRGVSGGMSTELQEALAAVGVHVKSLLSTRAASSRFIVVFKTLRAASVCAQA